MSWFSPAWFTEAASAPDPHSITIIPCPHESSSHALPTPILRHGPTNPSRGSSASGGYDNQQPSRAPMVPQLDWQGFITKLKAAKKERKRGPSYLGFLRIAARLTYIYTILEEILPARLPDRSLIEVVLSCEIISAKRFSFSCHAVVESRLGSPDLSETNPKYQTLGQPRSVRANCSSQTN